MTNAPEKTWFGHPRGLATLFFTEMWERFSYYGMRAFLILYITTPVSQGGLGFGVDRAGRIYGLYTGSVWFVTIGGGLIADWLLGQYRSALLGGILIAAGHFTLAFPSIPTFYAGLVLIVLGTGLLKPNVSTMVGSLYSADDPRRDAGFSVFYMGINLGAVIGPLVAGYLAQKVDWHAGFACAGVGMACGLVQYMMGREHLVPALNRLSREPAKSGDGTPDAGHQALTSVEWKRILAVVVFFAFACIFWAGYEQAGSTLNLFADRYTRLSFFGFEFPSSWFQSIPSFYVIVFAPVFAWLWIKLGPREPSSPAKFAIGLFCIGLSFFIMMIPGAAVDHSGDTVRVSPWWLMVVYLLQEFGELTVSPVGLSLVTKLAPRRIVGVMMGVWFLSISFGNVMAGYLAGFFPDPTSPGRTTLSLTNLFGIVGVAGLAACILLAFLLKPVRKLMGGIH